MQLLSSNFVSLALLGVASKTTLAANDSYTIPDSVSNDTSRVNYPFFMPPGCTCRRSMVNDEQCDQFDCECQCDITAGACDINCCCDPECTNDEVSAFSSCLDEGAHSPVVKMCVERPPALQDVNLRSPLRLSDSPEDELHGLMCIEKDNSAVKGNFFEDQGYPRASQIFSPGGKGSKRLGFHSYNREASSVKTSADYQLGDHISAYRSFDQKLANYFGGYFILPSADDGGNCIELNAVAFGKDEAGTCSTYTDDLAVGCEGQLSPSRYISRIYVEKTKGSAILGASIQTSMGNGALLPIRIETFTDSSGDLFTDIDDIPQNTTWEESSSRCTNALKRLAYTVKYNHTEIVDISVEIETMDIEDTAREVQQEFAVNFESTEVESSERSNKLNNMITRVRSGNPGYIVGRPTLGAVLSNANDTASHEIAQKQAGFTVMDTGVGGQCSTSSPTGSTVGFANDIFVGCTQLLTRDELRDFCTSNQHPMLTSHKVGADNFMYPKWLRSDQNLLGIFGNADPLDRRQWIKIESALDDPDSFTMKSRSFLEAENRCLGMPSRVRIEILWTHVGNVDSPQRKILSAKKSFEDGPSLQMTLPPNEKQPYSFITTVSWTYLEPKYSLVKSPPPTLIFSVPHDVFYPFQMNSATTGRRNFVLPSIILASIFFFIALYT